MTQIVLALEDELVHTLQVVSKRSQLRQEEIVQHALRKYFAELDEGDDPLIGLFDLKDPQLAEKSEEILSALVVSSQP